MSQLSVAVVGLMMGQGHLWAYSQLPVYRLSAVCDINEELAAKTSAKYGNVPYFTSYTEMLEKLKPDVVNLSTPTALHCEMTLQAAQKNVRGIYCEKPIAMNMREGRAMRDACAEKGIHLAIGHQRRVSSPYVTMLKAIKDGLIGDVYLIRGICAGDFLTDGTHTVDSMMYLNGDSDAKWVLGQIFRGNKATNEEVRQNRYAYIGTRYGHNIEQGAMACFQLSNGVRCETFTGAKMLMPGRSYQDIEVFGSKGRLWRNNDSAEPPVQINTNGRWEELPPPTGVDDRDGLVVAHDLFADSVLHGKDNPMDVTNAMKGFEIVMSIYESARTHAQITLPLQQDEYPLDLMLKDRGDF